MRFGIASSPSQCSNLRCTVKRPNWARNWAWLCAAAPRYAIFLAILVAYLLVSQWGPRIDDLERADVAVNLPGCVSMLLDDCNAYQSRACLCECLSYPRTLRSIVRPFWDSTSARTTTQRNSPLQRPPACCVAVLLATGAVCVQAAPAGRLWVKRLGLALYTGLRALARPAWAE